MVTLDDCLEAEDICKADASFQKLMRERYNITDMATLACDPWYYGGRYSRFPRHRVLIDTAGSMLLIWLLALSAFIKKQVQVHSTHETGSTVHNATALSLHIDAERPFICRFCISTSIQA